MEQSPFPLVHMESPWVGELQPPTPATLDTDLWDKQPGLVWSLMEEPQEHGVEVNQLVKVSGLINAVNVEACQGEWKLIVVIKKYIQMKSI